MLDNRLSACAEMVSGKGTAVDVGTDHGYLPCYLVSEGKAPKAVAADINTAPLDSAVKNIEKYGLSDKVKAVLSDGLKEIDSGNVTDVIIAGMGGELIAKIISEGKDFYSAGFILQPMTKAEHLRRWLFENGFEIERESAAKDEFYYTVILAKYTGNNTPYSDFMLYAGKMGNNTETERAWLLKQAEKLSKRGNGLAKAGDTDEARRYLSISDEITNYAKQGERTSV